jgi:hypothetical protein
VRIPAASTLWLQGLHRPYKFAILLIAAWAPVTFPRRPYIAAGVLALATALFLIATRSARQPAVVDSGRAPPVDPQS